MFLFFADFTEQYFLFSDRESIAYACRSVENFVDYCRLQKRETPYGISRFVNVFD